MTEPGVGYLSTLRRLCVGRIVGLLGLVVIATSGAEAGAWETFETRCLVPMEQVTPPVLDALVAEEPQDGYLIFTERSGLMMRLQGALDAPPACLISGFEWDDMVSGAVRSWTAGALNAERYELLPKISLQSPTVLRSTTWRKPKIEVSYQSFDPEWGPYLIVRETDLES